MAKYTTGEAAKLCGVTVRTVQYYDARDILKPSELSEGGRRLYSEADIRRLRIICFLREAGLSINSISDLLSESDPGSVINTLLDEQERILRDEMAERQARLDRVEGIRRELKRVENFSVESLGDIAYTGKQKAKPADAYDHAAGRYPHGSDGVGRGEPVDCDGHMVAACAVCADDRAIWGVDHAVLSRARGVYLPRMPRSVQALDETAFLVAAYPGYAQIDLPALRIPGLLRGDLQKGEEK